jgi:L-alanine-DL-glutamate epimerase-like enolase superfamily enzyme
MTTIDRISVTPFVIPTATPESDGTFEWEKTTLVLVEAEAAGMRGLGYTYADTSTAVLIKDLLAGVVRGRTAMDVAGAWDAMVRAVRNLGRPGIASMAIAAVDNALWDLKSLFTAAAASRRTRSRTFNASSPIGSLRGSRGSR